METDLVLSSGFLAFARQTGVLSAVEDSGMQVGGVCAVHLLAPLPVRSGVRGILQRALLKNCLHRHRFRCCVPGFMYGVDCLV